MSRLKVGLQPALLHDRARAGHSKIIGNLLSASAGSIVFFGASFLRNLALARILGPSAFGVWSLGYVLLQYAQWSHLFLLNAYRLDGPRRRGASDAAAVAELRHLNAAAVLAPAALVAIGGLAFGMLSGASEWGQAVLLVGITILPYQLFTFASSNAAVEENFQLTGRMQAALAIFNLALTVPLAAAAGYLGALAALALSYVATLVWYYRTAVIWVRPRVNWRLVRLQFLIGLPVGLNGLVTALFLTVDRTLVAWQFGATALGLYGLTALARSSIGLLPSAISEVIYVRMATMFGETRSIVDVTELALRVDRILAFSLPIPIGLAVLWMPFAIDRILPAYSSSEALLSVFLIGLFLSFPLYGGTVLVVSGRAGELVALRAIATGLEVAAIVVLARAFGLVGAAAGTVVSTVALFTMVAIWGFRRGGARTGTIASHFVSCVAPFVVMVLSLIIALRFGSSVGGWSIPIETALYIGLSVPILVALVFADRGIATLRRDLRLRFGL